MRAKRGRSGALSAADELGGLVLDEAEGRERNGAQGGLQSLDSALLVLRSLVEAGGALTLTEIARTCAMPPSKAHRYLASFLGAGLVMQAGRSGKYDLGRGALDLGLAALARRDVVNDASDRLPDLRDATGMTALLAVWGNGGATVVRWERAASPVVTSMGLGTVLPLLTSATGRAFLAWAPPAPLGPFVAAEAARLRDNPGLSPDIDPSAAGIAAMRDAVRAAGHASVDGRFIPGLVAAAAPVLDWQGEAGAVVTLIGTDRTAVRPDAEPVAKLKAFCAALGR